MAYPTIDREIDRMIEVAALANPMPRRIARKAGLRPLDATSTVATSAVRTLVDAWIAPEAEPFCYQWLVDLAGFSKIRMTTQAAPNRVDLYYSTATSQSLDPGDYDWLLGLRDGADLEEVGDNLFWTEIPEELRVSMRVTLNISGDFSVPPASIAAPFSLSLQASLA